MTPKTLNEIAARRALVLLEQAWAYYTPTDMTPSRTDEEDRKSVFPAYYAA